MTENEITYIVRGAAFKVLNNLGPGLLESIYEKALAYEIRKCGLETKTQVPVSVVYDKIDLGIGLRLDLIIENKVIIEIKSVESLKKVMAKQLLTYLKLSKCSTGLLINFNVARFEAQKSIIRIVNDLR